MKLQELKNQLYPSVYNAFLEKGVQGLVNDMHAGMMPGIGLQQAAQIFQAAAMILPPNVYSMVEAIADYDAYMARLRERG